MNGTTSIDILTDAESGFLWTVDELFVWQSLIDEP